jgi:hypothetical protein
MMEKIMVSQFKGPRKGKRPIIIPMIATIPQIRLSFCMITFPFPINGEI